MGANYNVQKISKKFVVKEIKTDSVIQTFNTIKEANSLAKKMNNGGGFDGWSPTFILKKVADI